MRWIPFLLLFGCPVEPKDVQDLNQGNNSKNPQNQMSGAGNSQPPGQPQQNGGGQGAGGQGAGGQGAGGQGAGQGDGGQGMGGQGSGGQPPVQEADAIPLPPENGSAGAENLSGEGDGTNPTADFANEGQAGTPPDVPVSGNVLPMYNQLPQFADIITGDTVAITLIVSGATSFEFEFVVKREGDGRIYPKVLHKESGATSPVIITAPATVDEPVWLVITADKTGDGPTPDDLVGGPTEAIMINGSNLSLEYTLSEDSNFLKNLPWFSQAMEIPVLGGM